MRGEPRAEATLGEAQAAIQEDFTPRADMRASAWYRSTVAANLLARLFEPEPASSVAGMTTGAPTLQNWRELADG